MRAALPDVVVLSSVEWDAARQRHHAFAEGWARAGRRVFFVENTGVRAPGPGDLGRVLRRLRRLAAPAAGRAPAGVEVVSPLVLPPTRLLLRRVNEDLLLPRLIDRLRARGLRPGPLIFAYLPTATTLALLDRLAPSLVVYDCVDNFAGLPSPPPDLAAAETALMARAGLVLTTSRTLFEDKAPLHPDVVELHHGAGPAFFLPPREPGPAQRLCYFGTIWRALDYAPIRALAEAGFDVELIGPVKEAPPPLPRSVRLRGAVPYEALPGLLAGFDALLLPYVDDEYNRGVIPAKTYECLATGRPVLASPLPALAGLAGLLTICRTPAEWVEAARAISSDGREDQIARVAAARAQTEEAAFERLERAVIRVSRRRAPPPAPPTRRRGLLSGLTWIGLLYGAAKAATLATQFLAGRWLGPAEYGVANLAVAAATYLQIVPMLGFPTATAKLLAEETEEVRQDRLASTALITFAVWLLIGVPSLIAARGAIARALALPPGLFGLALLMAIASAANQAVGAPLLGLKRFADRGVVEMIYGYSAPVVLVVLGLSLGATHRALLLALSAGLLAGAASSLWSLRARLKPVFDLAYVRAVGGYAATATVLLFSNACVQAPARLLLNRHAGAAATGLFSAYFTSTVQVSMALLYMLSAVLVPLASGAEGQRDLWRLFRRRAAPAAAGAFGLFFLAAVAGLALFGRRYPLSPAWAAVFAAAAALVLLHGAASALYAARDFSGLRLSVAGALAAGLGNLWLTFVFVPRLGVPGAALALALSFAGGLAFYGLCGLWERRRA